MQEQKELMEINKSHSLVAWGLIFVFWTIIGLFATIQTYIHYSVHNFERKGSLIWSQLLIEILPPWYYWALITPLVFYIGKKFPLRLEKIWFTFPINLIFSIVLTFPFLIVSSFFYHLSFGLPISIEGIWSFIYKHLISDFHFSLLTYWAILGFGFAFNFYRQLREREIQATKMALHSSQLENQLIQAKLDTLKSQIHPHFLFNTLNAVSAIMGRDLKSARRVIARLSELLRINLETSDKQFVSFREELDLLNLYLEIEQERFRHRLTINIDIPTEIWECEVPHFILQPLVENAIKHGISNNESNGLIKISAFRNDDKLQIQIDDNGKGIPDNLKEGIGLSNTKERLEKLYRSDYKLIFQDSDLGGTRVLLRIPLKLNTT